MTEKSKAFLFDLLSTPSPTGWETRGQQVWINSLKGSADSIDHDSYGNAWATLTPKDLPASAPTLLLESHADEIGFIIKHITDEGFLAIDRLGGTDHATARGRYLTILGDHGDLPGIIGNTAIHLRNRDKGEQAPEVHDLFVDVGASSAEQVRELGLRVGQPAVYRDTAIEFGSNRIAGRALDNRIGGFILSEVLAKLADQRAQLKARVHVANCVHEEIGGAGSTMVAHRLQPSVCLVLDVTHATDSPGLDSKKHGHVKLGGGPTLTHGAANQTAVVRHLMEIAAAHSLPIQHEAASRSTGTDADSIYPSRNGIPTALVSLPLRYMHSVVETADFRDVEATIDLLAAFAMELSNEVDFNPKLTTGNTH